ncbi:2 TM domain-containing transmembrane protein [Acrasis kona]|uniref:2 TM domain-containing transmembrane protein n=1 Tax=Acrasis kona TaxID=1008807 RepID=A0AAW2ZP38_9EUKA
MIHVLRKRRIINIQQPVIRYYFKDNIPQKKPITNADSDEPHPTETVVNEKVNKRIQDERKQNIFSTLPISKISGPPQDSIECIQFDKINIQTPILIGESSKIQNSVRFVQFALFLCSIGVLVSLLDLFLFNFTNDPKGLYGSDLISKENSSSKLKDGRLNALLLQSSFFVLYMTVYVLVTRRLVRTIKLVRDPITNTPSLKMSSYTPVKFLFPSKQYTIPQSNIISASNIDNERGSNLWFSLLSTRGREYYAIYACNTHDEGEAIINVIKNMPKMTDIQ